MKFSQGFKRVSQLTKILWLFCCGFSVTTGYAAEMQNATVFNQPRNIAAFKLQDDAGKPFTNANLQGHWSLLFFGFTNCAMICPTTMTELNKMYQILQKAKVEQLPQVVFISVDPERDSIKRIHDYVVSFNPKFIGATGEESQIVSLTKQMGVMFMKIADKDDPKKYAIDHSAFVVLVNPKGQMYGIFSSPHQAEEMAKSYQQIIKG